jgi:hypothetical protein
LVSHSSLQKVERPLSSLISDITISPPLAAIILDTNVGDPWINAIIDFEGRLIASKARTRVKAARDLAEVIEGLRIVVSIFMSSYHLIMSDDFAPKGSDQTACIFLCTLSTYSRKCNDKYASDTDLSATEV